MPSEGEKRWPGVTLVRPGGTEVTRPWVPHRGETIDESYETERYLPLSEHQAALKVEREKGEEEASNRLYAFFDDGEFPEAQIRSRLAFENRRADNAEVALAKARTEAGEKLRQELEAIPPKDWPRITAYGTIEPCTGAHPVYRGVGREGDKIGHLSGGSRPADGSAMELWLSVDPAQMLDLLLDSLTKEEG